LQLLTDTTDSPTGWKNRREVVGIYREEARRERGGRREDGAEKRVLFTT
jgi:hypothetical protein